MKERRFVNQLSKIVGVVMLVIAEQAILDETSIWYGIGYAVGGCILIAFGFRDKIRRNKDKFY